MGACNLTDSPPGLFLSGVYLKLRELFIGEGWICGVRGFGFGKRELIPASQFSLNWEEGVIEVHDKACEEIRDGGGWEE